VHAAGPHTFAALQTSGDVHEPHEATLRTLPQLSASMTAPQFFPSLAQNTASLSALQLHTLFAPHVAGAVHAPHDATVRVAPQLSAAVTPPQFLASLVQNAVLSSAVQPHRFAVPPPPQALGAAHVPQVTVRAVLQLSGAVTLPQFLPLREQNAASLSAVQPQTFPVPPPAQV
jgi:hypothetical protein